MAGIDLRLYLPPVRDQGARNTCVAFAVTTAHERVRPEVDALSEEGLYWGCKQADGIPASGTTFNAAADALDRWGQPRQEDWPYDMSRRDSDPLPVPPPSASNLAIWHRATLRSSPRTVDAVKSHLDTGTPVVLGIRIGYDFQLSHDGRIPMPASGRQPASLHAILAVGYTNDDLIFRNSWGPGWGDGGYGYLPVPYFSQHGLQAWTVGL